VRLSYAFASVNSFTRDIKWAEASSSTAASLAMNRITHATAMKRSVWTSFFVLLLSLSPLSTTTAEAAAYRCVDDDGNTSYSEKPCSVDQRVNKIISGIGGGIEYHCELPQQLALKTAATMRDGQPSSTVFRQYGGIHTLSPTAISIINYVYQFKHNYEATTERIVALTEQRCEVGSFGVTDCAVFPASLVASVGGCHGSGHNVADLNQSFTSGNQSESSSNRNSQQTLAQNAASLPVTAKRSNESSADCRTRLRHQLEGLESRLNSATPGSNQQQLRAKQRELKRGAERC